MSKLPLGGGNSRAYRSLLPRRKSRDNAGYNKRTGQMDEEGEHRPSHPGVYILLSDGKRHHEHVRNLQSTPIRREL